MAWIRRFFRYSEIRTKITSISVIGLCLAYFLMRRLPLRGLPTLVFFLGMLLFDLATTTINNYIDSKSDGTILPFSRQTSLRLTISLLLAAIGLGIALVFLSDWFVLVLGGACFACGIFYTYGPVPISRLPLGELLSGLFYGLFIPWIFFYVNLDPAAFMAWLWEPPYIRLAVQVPNFLSLVLLAVAPFCCTANIMLANNICDLEKDLRQKRRTLPSYIGVPASLHLFAALALLPYLAMTAMALSGLARPIVLLAWLGVVPVIRNIRAFFRHQDKEQTFPLSLANYLLTVLSFALLMLVGIWI